jgi:pimeloyl-ACP methyl ester carboxylesterase
MKYCNTPGNTRIAYHIRNEKGGLPLVLLHGFCEDSSIWKPMLPGLREASVLRIDLPGFGKSELPALSAMTAYADAVLAVLDAENIEKCVLVGHSMGGYAALELAARRPERLAALVLFHSHPFEDNELRKEARRRGIETLQAGKKELYVTQLFPNLFPPEFVAKRPEVLEELIFNGKKQSTEAIIAALQAMLGRRDHQPTLQKIETPVLFLLGKEDTLVPLEQALTASLLPGLASVHVLPEVAHMGMWEAPEQSAQILRDFLRFVESLSHD